MKNYYEYQIRGEDEPQQPDPVKGCNERCTINDLCEMKCPCRNGICLERPF